jgi:hypothetical protein
MSASKYKSQVLLLLDVMPEVAAEECFAMHGGSAINLFMRDMPRLSVDIDLTYLPIDSSHSLCQKTSISGGAFESKSHDLRRKFSRDVCASHRRNLPLYKKIHLLTTASARAECGSIAVWGLI